jgi:hypothetical protein
MPNLLTNPARPPACLPAFCSFNAAGNCGSDPSGKPVPGDFATTSNNAFARLSSFSERGGVHCSS